MPDCISVLLILNFHDCGGETIIITMTDEKQGDVEQRQLFCYTTGLNLPRQVLVCGTWPAEPLLPSMACLFSP